MHKFLPVEFSYSLTTHDGDVVDMTLEEFFRGNPDILDTDTGDAIRGLQIGQTHFDGGGASPVWSIKRIA